MWALIAGAAAAGGAAALVAANMLGRYTGLTVPRTDPATLAHLLAPHLRFTAPEGAEGPVPCAILVSGCDGPRDNLDRWARALAAAGWASLVVDSHAPRGFTEFQIWRLICAGQLLTGAERAGDVAVAVAAAKARPEVDEGRIALVGFSHGGWAVLEFLSMADHGQVPLTLTHWPEGMAERPLDGVAAALLLYPYCGQLSRASRQGWRSRIPALFLLVEGDAIASEKPCRSLVAREAGRGLPVREHVYSGVTHGFDQQERAALSFLSFDAATTEDALARGTAFLRGAAA
ncbi:dienelactone hydrolase family protein [Rhodosalinus sp.]|uniref:dienelactone hydrolase family protein n=1 Tax=Rhodosalinus sp. TaxID=2047741 RepID=UPI00356691B9